MKKLNLYCIICEQLKKYTNRINRFCSNCVDCSYEKIKYIDCAV